MPKTFRVSAGLDFLQISLLANWNPEPYGERASGKCHPCFSQVDNRIIQDGAQQASGMVPVEGLCVYMCVYACMYTDMHLFVHVYMCTHVLQIPFMDMFRNVRSGEIEPWVREPL